MKANGEKELTVTVKDVAEIMVAAMVAGKAAGYSESAIGAMISTIIALFDDYADDILEYISEKQKEAECKMSFLKALKENGMGMN